MPGYYALAVVVGVLAVIATWIFGLPVAGEHHLQVWQAFIAWGCHFHSGGGVKGSRTAFVGMTFGALVGMAAVMLAGHLGSLGDFAAPVAVGLGAFVICLASAVPWLAVIPASVYGFAAIAGLILLKDTAPVDAIVPTAISVLIGAIFGYVSEALTNAITKKA
ncbi:MAG: DUF1097 domain-containing protein [Sphingobium sp.]|nr:DUF1097 domain-containing protein [Sphingobium sp.]